jgi:uncharacterized protein (TIGR00725 family)
MNSEKLPIIGVIGPSKFTCKPEVFEFGYVLGKVVAKLQAHLVCGGMEGLMESVCHGFTEVKRRKGKSIGIIPYDKKGASNPYCEIVIPTGIGIARNSIVVNTADILVAVAGGAGTLSEIAFAWQKNKHVICCTAFEGWAKQLAGQAIDNRRRKLLHEAASVDEIKEQITRLLHP